VCWWRKLAIEPVKGAETVTLIIITIGASLVIRGLIQVWLGKGTFSLPAFSGDAPIEILGATLMPQSLWVLGVTAHGGGGAVVLLQPHAAGQGHAGHLVQPSGG
jgi:branched-subunit amino acid ABC-type transport system permease component